MTILVVANTLGLTAQLAQVCSQPKTPLSSFHNICSIYIEVPNLWTTWVAGWCAHVHWCVCACSPSWTLPCHGRSWPHLHKHCCECHRYLRPNSYKDRHKHHSHLWPTCRSIAASVTGACGLSHMSTHSPTCVSNRYLCTHTRMHSHTPLIPSLLSLLPPTLGYQPWNIEELWLSDHLVSDHRPQFSAMFW